MAIKYIKRLRGVEGNRDRGGGASQVTISHTSRASITKGTLEGQRSRRELEELLGVIVGGCDRLFALPPQRTGLSKVSVASLRPYLSAPSNQIALWPLLNHKTLSPTYKSK